MWVWYDGKQAQAQLIIISISNKFAILSIPKFQIKFNLIGGLWQSRHQKYSQPCVMQNVAETEDEFAEEPLSQNG